MSFDLGVWHASTFLTDQEADAAYGELCEGSANAFAPHAAVDAFYAELTARYPEVDTVPDERVDDHDYCPWSAALDRSPSHVIMPCVWSQAENVERFVRMLALKHGLAVYDPQQQRVHYPPRS